MKSIEIEDDLYHFIASQTQYIGEGASDILRRLVMPGSSTAPRSAVKVTKAPIAKSANVTPPVQSTEQVSQAYHCQSQQVFSELEGQQLQTLPKIVDRWLLVLSVLHKYHVQQFSKVLGMSGRNRTYFAITKDTLLETGSSTNPKNVPGSEYWVITNNNTVKKINMLKEVAQEIGFSQTDVERLVELFVPQQSE